MTETEKPQVFQLEIPKPLLISIIMTLKDGESLDDRLTELLKEGLEARHNETR